MTLETGNEDPPLDLATLEKVELPEAARFIGTFDDLDVPDGIRKGLKDLGYTGPTPVQHTVFLPLRAGKDALVQSKTGSGKTTAFALPMLCALNVDEKRPQGLILCPTRELALQVSAETARLGHPAGIKVATIYGGASMRAQIDALGAGVHVVVGTPGRIKDLHRQGILRFENIKFCVLDEADEMLSRGFWDEVTSILDQLPEQRQTCLFSATLPDQIERASTKYLKDPQRINLSQDTLNVATIRHVLHLENEKYPKPRNFLYVLEVHKPKSGIVFCNRKDETELLCTYLRRFGYRAEPLNGDMPQVKRERTLARVKAGELDLMVATDVAARGIDISDLGHVFNYDLPEHDEVYVHRVGRTGRIGKRGTAASLVRGKFLSHLSTLKKQYKVPFEEVTLPDEKEILWMQAERLAVQILEDASGVEIEQYRAVAEAMLGRGDIKEIVAFLLRTHYAQGVRAPAPAAVYDDRPRDDRPRDDRPRDDRPRAPRDDRPRAPRDDRPREPRAVRPVDPTDARDPEAEADAEAGPAAANLYVSLGRQDGLADMTALVKRLSEMSGVDVGHFTGAGDVRDHSSHIEVDLEVANQILAAVHGKLRHPDAPVVEAAPAAEGEAPAAGPATIVCERARPSMGRGRSGGGGGPGRGRGGPRRR